MEVNHNSSLSNRQGKDNKQNSLSSQLRRFNKYLKTNIASCTMACDATDVEQKNATRYKRQLEKKNLLWVIGKDACKLTTRKVQYLTTNKELAKKLGLIKDSGNE